MKSLDQVPKVSGLVVPPVDSCGWTTRRVFLQAGQVWTATLPTEITTILGSCVAVCLWDATRGVGGMNHYLLPYDFGDDVETPRYANHAMTLLLEQLRAAGADSGRLRAKIFGGARFVSSTDPENDLGRRNVRAARERLHAENIPIIEEHTLGTYGRKVIYQSGNGTTTVLRVSRVIP